MKFPRSMRFKLKTIRQLTARIESLKKGVDHSGLQIKDGEYIQAFIIFQSILNSEIFL